MQGGREGRDLDATELAQAAQALGAGELLLNCIDRCSPAGFCLVHSACPVALERLPVPCLSSAAISVHEISDGHRT